LETEVARAAAAVEPAVAAREAAHAEGGGGGGDHPADREAAKAATNLAAFAACAAARLGLGDAAFFGLLRSDPARYLPCIYTPSVGDACLAWGRLPYRPPCLYLSAADAGRMENVVRNWPLPPPPVDGGGGPARGPRLAVLTDGARILGLGDLGAQGAGIPVGKCMLHAAAGGLGPGATLPVSLDFGCDNPAVRDDPLYPGLPQGRAKGPAYDALMAEALAALLARFPGLIIHYEDFATGTADALLRRVAACAAAGGGNGGRARTPTLAPAACPPSFSDDIQATGAAALAALLGAAALPGVPALKDGRFLFYGAGQAAVGTARAVVAALEAEGVASEDARARIFLVDTKGLVTRARPEGSLSALKAEFARPAADAVLAPPGTPLAGVVAAVRPTVLIGAAAVGGAFSDAVLRAAAASCPRPVILALSNPDTAAECRGVDVDRATGGAAVFAAGTAQPDHVSSASGRPVSPAFANNALVFPGVGLGAAVCGATSIGDAAWLAAARAVAGCVRGGDAAAERVLPEVGRLVEVTAAVAAAVAAACVAAGTVAPDWCDARLLKAVGGAMGSGRVGPGLAKAAAAVVGEAQFRPE
jgi:malate dehydrogenase (oxaloacetate-decarboxylating)(NADP+)